MAAIGSSPGRNVALLMASATPLASARFSELRLPPVPAVVGAYRRCVRSGDLVYVAGQMPVDERGQPILGVVGKDVTVERAADAAESAFRRALAVLREELGSLEAIERFVRVQVFVRSGPEFTDHPAVANGATRLIERFWGPGALPARTAVGAPSLPRGICVEVDVVAQVRA